MPARSETDQAGTALRRLLGVGLTVEERAASVIEGFRGQVMNEQSLTKKIAEVLRDQIEDCAMVADQPGTYEEVDLCRDIAEQIRKLKKEARAESDS
ncbi:MAG: hypothetical protein MOB07_01965 [Acidobacteria bacterium]|nr:hypothetical protein [Acidobacteriota bacterium]